MLYHPWIFESKTWFGKVKSLQRLDKWRAIIINLWTELRETQKASKVFSFASYNNQRPRKLNDLPKVQRQKEQSWESRMGRSFKSKSCAISPTTPQLPLDDGGILGTEQKCEGAVWGLVGAKSRLVSAHYEAILGGETWHWPLLKTHQENLIWVWC